MTNVPIPPEAAELPYQPERRISWPRTIGASAAVTAAGLLAINVPLAATIGNGDVPRYIEDDREVEHTDETVIEPGYRTYVPPEVIDPGKEVRESFAVQQTGNSPWARLFEQDPAAEVFSRKAINGIVTRVDDLKASGATDIRITVTGWASAEDDNPDNASPAGLQSPSDNNQRLATARGRTFVSELKEALEAEGYTDVTVQQNKGREASLSDAQMQQLEEYRQQFGYDSIDTMVQRWNRMPNQVPPAVEAYLDRVTGLRGVEGDLIASVPAADAPEPTFSDPYCELEETIRVDITSDIDEGWQLPIVIPFFWVRRVYRDVEEPVENETPAAGEPEPTPTPNVAPPEDDEDADSPQGGGGGLGGRPGCLPLLGYLDGSLPAPAWWERSQGARRGLGRLAAAALVVAAVWAYKQASFDGKNCWIEIDKDQGAFVPDINLPFDCDIPWGELFETPDYPPPTAPVTFPTRPDPCDSVPLRRETRTVTYRDGTQVSDSTQVTWVE